MRTAGKLLALALAALWPVEGWAATLVANQNANAPTGSNIYSTLQAAVTAASAGDLILVVPSGTPSNPTSYGAVTINKQLTIRGNGLNPNKDLPGISMVDNITLLRDASGNASGTVIEGLRFSANSGISNSSPSTLQISNIEIRQCQFINTSSTLTFIDLRYGDNTIIRNCIFEGINSFDNGYIGASYTENNNITISNNVFTRTFVNIRNGTVANNLFLDFLTITNTAAIGTAVNSTISNNIFYGPAPAGTSVGTCVYNHNLSFSPYDDGNGNNVMPPTGSGGNTGVNNINDQDPLLTAIPSGGTEAWSFAYDLSLQSGSPGKNAGTDANDIGVFGGTYPYSVDVAFPIIQQLSTSAVVPQGTNLSVTVKAKSN